VAQPYQLVVDLGTFHTVAVVRRAGEAPRPLLFDGSPLLPSGVYRDPDGRLTVGRDAERLAAAAPSRYEPYPKRTVDDGSVLLGDGPVPVVELFAAILRRVLAEAALQGAEPATVTLTCPADWGPRRREVLLAAARAAGMPPVLLVDEPIAAATYCAEVLRQQIPAGSCLLVFDFGGGTLDVTVVRRDAQGLRVLAVGGLDDLGGVDVDAALVGHLGQLVSLRAPQLWHRLTHPQGTGDLRDRKAFWDQVRGAKEMLSRASSAPVPLPGSDDAVHLTREELDRIAGPLVDRAVDETRRVLDRAGVIPGTLTGLLLVGGSSRIPLVASRLHARFGVAPTVPEQPELPVAYGGLLVTGGARPQPPAMSPVMSTPVMTTPPQGMSALPPLAMPPPVRQGAPRRRAARAAFIVPVALTVLAGAAWAGVHGIQSLKSTAGSLTLGSHGGSTGGSGSGGGGGLTQIAGSPIALPAGAVAGMTATANAVVYATVVDGHTAVHSVPLPGGKGARWDATVPVQPSELTLRTVGDLIVVDAKQSATDGGKDTRAVLDATGKYLWKREWQTPDTTDLEYIGTDAIVAHEFNRVTQRVNLRTGKVVWTHNAPSDVPIAWHHAVPSLAWQAGVGSATAPIPLSGKGFQESLVADATKVVQMYEEDGTAEVLDAASGHRLVGGQVGLQDDLNAVTWTAYDGLLVGAAKEGAPTLVAYRLSTLKQAWRYPLPAGASVQLLKACGEHRICVSSEVNSEYQVMAVDTTSGKAAWGKPLTAEFADEPGWYVLGQKMVYGYRPFTSIGGRQLPLSLPNDAGVANPLLRDASITMNAGNGRYGALVGPQLHGSTVDWVVSLVDLTSGRSTAGLDVGAAKTQPTISVVGTTVTVLYGDKVYVAQAKNLAAR
jgi:molecular chaperone HscA